MHVTRLDLDGSYSPGGLVAKILKTETDLKIPVPIENLCYQLDITEIANLKTEGFLGGLITDEERSDGIILIQNNLHHQRRRFTIAHELGHFLIPFHKPAKPGKFLCDKQAMKEWNTKEKNRASKMEAEANQFAAHILMPPPHLRKLIGRDRYASLEMVLEIHETFDVSKDAAARTYAEYNPECLAIIIARHGKLLRYYKSRDFPWLSIRLGDCIPNNSALYTATSQLQATPTESTQAELWIDTRYGRRIPRMLEQVMPQSNGFAMILLKLPDNDDDDYDPDENLTSKQRYNRNIERWKS